MKQIPEPDVEFNHIKTVKIHHVIYHETFEEFASSIIQMAVTNHQTSVVFNWADGIAFLIGFFPDNDKMVEDNLIGITHWRHIMLAPLPTYTKKVTTSLGEVMLTKRENDPVLRAVIRRLKEDYNL